MLTYLTARSAPRLLLLLSFDTPRRAMSTFKLDKNIFNPTLYKQVADVWLSGVDLRGQELDQDVVKRWFQGSPEEKLAFDGVCRENFAHALEAIGPDKLPAADPLPFMSEIQHVADSDESGNGEAAAWTALSLTLLLDQIPRNIYRTDEGLRKVYNHYDHLSYALARKLLSSSSPIPRVDLHPQWRHSAAHRAWFYLPLMHSEDIESHNLFGEILGEFQQEIEKLEGYAARRRETRLAIRRSGGIQLVLL